MASSRPPLPSGRFANRLSRLRSAAVNAAEIARFGRLTKPQRTPYEIVHVGPHSRLRRYGPAPASDAPADGKPASPLLLVPPLMLSSEVYDMAPELSAVSFLLEAGFDVWTVDFGAPEEVEGGMNRTLDDHVRAVVSAVDFVKRASGRDVHLVGYSQGGMFAYQAAAFRRGADVASLITFGSPVDIHRALPFDPPEALAGPLLSGVRQLLMRPLSKLQGLPSTLTMVGFKVISPRKEVSQLAEFLRKLHDRQALERRETRRRFLGGEGFVAWPGPALRTFIDEFIVRNRLSSGGFVVDGRTVSLADIPCPILYFIGAHDEIARAPSVRAIRAAAVHARVYEAEVPAGHLGLVVGSRALSQTWPTVVEWVAWLDRDGPRPAALGPKTEPAPASGSLELDARDVYDLATDAVEERLSRLGRAAEEVTGALRALRWQVPRFSRLLRMRDDTRIGPGQFLAEQASRAGDATFFLWAGRAFSYRAADRRVDRVAKGLRSVGVEPGQRIGVVMRARPSFLTVVTALNRVGAVAVIVGPQSRPARLAAVRSRLLPDVGLDVGPDVGLGGGLYGWVTDPEHAAVTRSAVEGPVWVLGGAGDAERHLPEGVFDLEAIDVAKVQVPPHTPNPGRASELAMVLTTFAADDSVRLARITHRRWAFSALGTAAAATLTPRDTVYSVLPLHHPAGLLVAVGGALVGGSRLALSSQAAPPQPPANDSPALPQSGPFWREVRRYGASVVFYAGEMCRPLVDAPPDENDRNHPVRLFAGSGMRKDVWERMGARFGVGILEFYASTECSAILANAEGKDPDSVGQSLPGAAPVLLVGYDFEHKAIRRDELGRPELSPTGAPGLLLAELRDEPGGDLDAEEGARVVRDVLQLGDRFFVTGMLMRQDEGGDFSLLDRLSDPWVTPSGVVFTREVEDVLYRHPDIAMVVVYGVEGVGLCASLTTRGPEMDWARFRALVDRALQPHQAPRFVRWVERLPMTAGYRPMKDILRREATAAADHSGADHSAADHSAADHSAADHSAADHSAADHSGAGHSGAGHSAADHSAADHSAAGSRDAASEAAAGRFWQYQRNEAGDYERVDER